MRRAIALAAVGLGTTSPNPPVGCVLLGPVDQIVGEGYHERKGEAHAEAQALAAAGPLAARAAAVVTLQEAIPDSHGKAILALKDHPPGTSTVEASAALSRVVSGGSC